jgi:hypothetical protein
LNGHGLLTALHFNLSAALLFDLIKQTSIIGGLA